MKRLFRKLFPKKPAYEPAGIIHNGSFTFQDYYAEATPQRHLPRMAPRRIPGRIQRPTNRNRRTPPRKGKQMSEHGYTSHGHSLPGKTQHPENRPQVANCGGPIICKQCRAEVATAMKEMFQTHQSEGTTGTPERDQKDRLSQTLGKYVADSRRRNFLTQRVLADRMNEQFGHNWHQTVVGKIENGTRELKAEELFHLAVIFKHYEIADPIIDIIGKFGANQ